MQNKPYTNDYKKKASVYAKHSKDEGTLFLAYKEFRTIFDKHLTPESKSILALDYGTGTGRSRRYLESLGFKADGVDINKNMLREAIKIDSQDSKYFLINNGKIPQRNSKYDLIFSSLVVLEIQTMQGIIDYFIEAERVMKFNGTMVVLTVNDCFYKHQWVSVDTNYPGNSNAKSGDKVRVKIREIDLELDDYYWTKKDYKNAANKAGLIVVDIIEPKGTLEDGIEWMAESIYPPYVILVLKKKKSLKNINEVKKEHNLENEVPGRGIFSEIHRDSEMVPKYEGLNFLGDRSKSATLKLLMKPGDFWPFHKLKSIETFKFIEGNDLVIHCVLSNGDYKKIYLGEEHEESVNNFIVPSGCWYAEEVFGNKGYCLVEITTTPGFDQDDLLEANLSDLLDIIDKSNTELIKLIKKLCCC